MRKRRLKSSSLLDTFSKIWRKYSRRLQKERLADESPKRTMKEPKLNRDWHNENRMPIKATMEQRLQWHLEHANNCGCRSIPLKVAEEMERRGISLHIKRSIPNS